MSKRFTAKKIGRYAGLCVVVSPDLETVKIYLTEKMSPPIMEQLMLAVGYDSEIDSEATVVFGGDYLPTAVRLNLLRLLEIIENLELNSVNKDTAKEAAELADGILRAGLPYPKIIEELRKQKKEIDLLEEAMEKYKQQSGRYDD